MNQYFKILRKSLISGALILSIMLTGFSGDKNNSKKISLGSDVVVSYSETDGMKGNDSADNVDKYIKTVTFKQGGAAFTKLLAIKDYVFSVVRASRRGCRVV